MIRIGYGFAFGLLFLLHACGSGLKTSTVPVAAPDQPAPSPVLSPTAVVPTPISTAILTGSPPSTGSAATTAILQSAEVKPCVPPDDQASLATATAQVSELGVSDYLNRGGLVEELASVLQKTSSPAKTLPVAAADMTGDGLMDVAVSLPAPGGDAMQPGGSLIIFVCQEGHLDAVYHEQAQATETGPHIRFLEDLNGDGRADLVKSRTTCGAHTCFEDVGILVWNVETFENRLAGSSADLPNPQIAVYQAADANQHGLEVTGTGVGSVGAGPSRPVKREWKFNPLSGYWEVIGETAGDPIFRIHVVYDADRLAFQGEYVRAEALYQKVIEDDDLQPWNDPLVERANLSAYAIFKLIVLADLQGDKARAENLMREFKTQFPPESPQNAFVQMAEAFEGSFQPGKASAGCQAARLFTAQHPQEVLNIFDYGYANPTYTAESLCPW